MMRREGNASHLGTKVIDTAHDLSPKPAVKAAPPARWTLRWFVRAIHWRLLYYPSATYHAVRSRLGWAKRAARELARRIVYAPWLYDAALALATPLNFVLAFLLQRLKHKNSVLHVSYMVHIPYYATRLLRRLGMKADYLALEENPRIWDKSDYLFLPHRIPIVQFAREFKFFWTVVARYEVIHAHFAVHMSAKGWELRVLKWLGRKLVIHFRGCEIRDRQKNLSLHPRCNICQACDYHGSICSDPVRRQRRTLAERYGDLFLVTTPDMKDFVPDAIYFPFFLPEIQAEQFAATGPKWPQREAFRIVHVTGHPGIEGTKEIRQAIERLRAKGHRIDFRFLHLVNHDQVLHEIADADLTIGKMKMGYYANAQIESMFLGVPAITRVRPEFMTAELERSGFIFSTLEGLEATIEHYLLHPEDLQQKRAIARSSVLEIHDNDRLGSELIELYRMAGKRGARCAA
jgi:hypothetical protein